MPEYRFENLVELFEQSVRAHADRPLFGMRQPDASWRWTSYAEFHRSVDALRAGLAGLGVDRGDRVAIVANNRVEWAVAAYATYGREAVFVPMYEAQAPEEWELILRDCEAKLVFGGSERVVAALEGMHARLPALEHLVAIEGSPAHGPCYADLIESGHRAPVAARHPDAKSTAGFIYTSGTTGTPKGVVLSHGNLCTNLCSILSVFPLGAEDRTLSFLPWAHLYGQVAELHALVAVGASTAFNDAVPNLLRNLSEVRPTILVAVPRIFNRLYQSVEAELQKLPGPLHALVDLGVRSGAQRSRGERIGLPGAAAAALADRLVFRKVRGRFGGRLRLVISGSAQLNPAVAEFIDAVGIPVYEGYGLTETSPIVTANWPGSRKLGSAGRPIPGVTVKIDASVSPVAGEGEILVYGPNVMQGYHGRPEETAAVLLPDGGFRTGDLGRFDDEGYLFITGRIKEQYKLENGKYVMPALLEEQLKLSPYISNVMVHGANRPHNVALVILDMVALEGWAKEKGVTIGDPNRNEAVRSLIRSEIETLAKDFRGFERPVDFVLTGRELTSENGMLTPTLKLKRRRVLEMFGSDLEGLYGASASGGPSRR